MSKPNVSNPLIWEVVKKNNSFAKTMSGGPLIFTAEPNNLQNVQSYKFSSLAQPNGIIAVNKNADGKDIDVTAGKSKLTMKRTNGVAKSTKTLEDLVEQKFYRRDLKKFLIARYSKLSKATDKAHAKKIKA